MKIKQIVFWLSMLITILNVPDGISNLIYAESHWQHLLGLLQLATVFVYWTFFYVVKISTDYIELLEQALFAKVIVQLDTKKDETTSSN